MASEAAVWYRVTRELEAGGGFNLLEETQDAARAKEAFDWHQEVNKKYKFPVKITECSVQLVRGAYKFPPVSSPTKSYTLPEIGQLFNPFGVWSQPTSSSHTDEQARGGA